MLCEYECSLLLVMLGCMHSVLLTLNHHLVLLKLAMFEWNHLRFNSPTLGQEAAYIYSLSLGFFCSVTGSVGGYNCLVNGKFDTQKTKVGNDLEVKQSKLKQ